MKLIAELSDLGGGGDVEADHALEHKGHRRTGQVGVHILLPLGCDLLRNSLALPAAAGVQCNMHGQAARDARTTHSPARSVVPGLGPHQPWRTWRGAGPGGPCRRPCCHPTHPRGCPTPAAARSGGLPGEAAARAMTPRPWCPASAPCAPTPGPVRGSSGNSSSPAPSLEMLCQTEWSSR